MYAKCCLNKKEVIADYIWKRQEGFWESHICVESKTKSSFQVTLRRRVIWNQEICLWKYNEAWVRIKWLEKEEKIHCGYSIMSVAPWLDIR